MHQNRIATFAGNNHVSSQSREHLALYLVFVCSSVWPCDGHLLAFPYVPAVAALHSYGFPQAMLENGWEVQLHRF